MDWDHLKKVVWLVEAECETELSFSTAFALDQPGFLMTVSHGVPESHEWKILARRIDNADMLPASIVSRHNEFDIAILKVDDKADFCYQRFAKNGELKYGQTVHLIGNPFEFIGSFCTGKVCYPCVNLPELRKHESPYENFVCTSHHRTPPYRIMGDIPKEDPEDLDHVHTPIIQIAGFVAGSGASGSPVFKENSEIVGMHAGTHHGFQYAIHISALRTAWNTYKNSDDAGAQGADRGGGKRKKKLRR